MDVTFVPRHRELVRHRAPFIGQLAPDDIGRSRQLCRRPLGARIGLAGGDRLGAFAALAVEGDGLQPRLPGLHVGRLEFLHARVRGLVHRLGDGARDERLGSRHHADVTHGTDRARAIGRAEGAIKDRQMGAVQAGRALDGLLAVHVVSDGFALAFVVTKTLQRLVDRVVDDLDGSAAHQPFVLDERNVGLDAGGVAIHHETDGARGRQHASLGVAEAVLSPQTNRVVPRLTGCGRQILGHKSSIDLVYVVAMLLHHGQKGLLVFGVAGEGASHVA